MKSKAIRFTALTIMLVITFANAALAQTKTKESKSIRNCNESGNGIKNPFKSTEVFVTAGIQLPSENSCCNTVPFAPQIKLLPELMRLFISNKLFVVPLGTS